MGEAARARRVPDNPRLSRPRPSRGLRQAVTPVRRAFRHVRHDGRALPGRGGDLPVRILRRRRHEPGGLERECRAGERPRPGPMRARVLAAFLTLAVFAAGFGAGLWAERHRPFPAPPGAFMGEFGARPGRAIRAGTPVNRAQLSEQIEKLRPEMESFRAHITEIYGQFDRDIEPILTPEQRSLYAKKFQARRGFGPPPEIVADDEKTLTDDQIEQLMQRPFRTLAFFVVIPMTLEKMTSDLKLDDAQRDKVKDFLRVRREKFIELVDSAPPPSLTLSRLAPLAQRLGAPAKPAGDAAH